MVSITQLGYLGLGVSNIEQWEKFATQILGLQISERGEDGSLFLRMDEYHHRFVVHPGGNDDLAYIGWEVTDERALKSLADQLKANGVEVSAGTRTDAEARRVAGLIRFKDPSGISSEAFYGPLVNYQTRFQSPRPISGFKTGEQGLGHFVAMVDDFDRSLNFYRDVLGMRVSDFIEVEFRKGTKITLAFLHCNPRHHTIAFVAARGAPKRLNHFMLQVESLDDVGATYYLCQQEKIPIPMNLGRHTNDHMVSFYVQTPSGFNVEYGWGAREVDDRTWQVQIHQSGSMWGHHGTF